MYAGKAHPHDEPAKDIIRRVFAAREELGADVPIVYLEEHDMGLAKLLTSGVDLWLNNPEKPMEASGTSGMKAALNGVPSLSVLDGWWPEGWIEGVTGWSIGEDVDYPEDPEVERSSLYNKLNYVIVPLFYGAPQNYGRVMRSTIARERGVLHGAAHAAAVRVGGVREGGIDPSPSPLPACGDGGTVLLEEAGIGFL